MKFDNGSTDVEGMPAKVSCAKISTVKTLIRAAALNFFHIIFGQNLLSKNLSYLRLLFKGGSYLSAALINVITVDVLSSFPQG